MTNEPAPDNTFEPKPIGHQATGCPAVFPWLPECIHYSGPGSLHRLAEQAKDIVLATEEEHIRNILAIPRTDTSGEIINTPDAERNKLVHLIDGNDREEASFQFTYESLLKTFEEEKARKLADEYKQNTFGTAAICFLEAYNYDTEALLTTGKLVNAYPPVQNAALEQVKEAIFASLDLWTSDADSEYAKEDWYNTGSNDVVSLLLHRYFGGEVIAREYIEDTSNWDLPEDEDEEYDDVATEQYYFLRLNGEDVDLFSQENQDKLRSSWVTEFIGEKPADIAELEGDAWRMSRYSILERRVHSFLTTGSVSPALHVFKW